MGEESASVGRTEMIIQMLIPALKRARAVAFGAIGLTASFFASADSISPSSYATSLGIGESVTITKTVTVTKAPPTAALIDVVFLFDITGSMGPYIANAQSSANGILSTLSGLGNVASATGWYADPTFDGGASALTTNGAITTAKINTFGQCSNGGGFNGALCGGDTPEVMYSGIVDATTKTAWRSGSNRFIVVLSDATTKTPPSVATTTAALSAVGAKVIGIDFSGAASSSYTAIGGAAYSGGTSAATLAAAITSGITNAFSTYSNVTVDDLGGGAPDIAVTSTCLTADIGTCAGGLATGTFDRSVDRTFTFATTFTRTGGSTTSSFDTFALVNGGIVAAEKDTIGANVPEPGTLALVALSLLGLGAARRRAA
jgi:hypothetical protein